MLSLLIMPDPSLASARIVRLVVDFAIIVVTIEPPALAPVRSPVATTA